MKTISPETIRLMRPPSTPEIRSGGWQPASTPRVLIQHVRPKCFELRAVAATYADMLRGALKDSVARRHHVMRAGL
jgi:hypothetical protein